MTVPESIAPGGPSVGDRMARINLVNLLNRRTGDRLAIVRMPNEPYDSDFEVYVTTRVQRMYEERNRPVLPRMPRLLSVIEALRGTRGVPYEIDLESSDALAIYIPTSKYLSDIPDDPREAVSFLNRLLSTTVSDFNSTVEEVESYFWRAAKQANFSEAIVEKMARKEKGFESHSLISRFEQLLKSYFSVKFRIRRSEQMLSWEE